ncbi:MAG: PIN domain-containing protein [Solirubrobacteraceae bacterium]
MKRAIADTSVFVAQESGRELGELPERIAVSIITAAELELGVLRALDTDTRSQRLATLTRVRSAYRLLPIDAQTASCFARIAAEELEAGRKLRRHDTWIAACAMRHGAAVVTQDEDFSAYSSIDVIRV